MEILSAVVGTIIGAAATYFLSDYRDKKNALRAKQKSINHVSLALTNISEITDQQLETKNQWISSWSEYEFKFAKDLAKAIENNFDELKGLSRSVAENTRELKIELNSFFEFIENQNKVSRQQAKKIYYEEGKDYLKEENSHDFFFFTENQRYHKWYDSLIKIEGLSQALAFNLIPHSLQKDTQNELKKIARR